MFSNSFTVVGAEMYVWIVCFQVISPVQLEALLKIYPAQSLVGGNDAELCI
jgi:hypothetical protein